MGCNGSKTAAPAKPEEIAAKTTLLDSSAQGQSQSKEKVDKLFESVGGFKVVTSEIDKMSVDELRAVLAKYPEDVRNKLVQVLGTPSTVDIFASIGGLSVVKAEIEKLSVDELRAQLQNMPEVVRKKLMVLLDDGAISAPASKDVTDKPEPTKQAEPEKPSVQPEPVTTAAQPLPEEPKVESVPAPPPVQQAGGFNCMRYCGTADQENEIVVRQN